MFYIHDIIRDFYSKPSFRVILGYSIFYPYRGMDDQIFKTNTSWKKLLFDSQTPWNWALDDSIPRKKWYLGKSHYWYEKFTFACRTLEILSENVNTLDWNNKRFDQFEKINIMKYYISHMNDLFLVAYRWKFLRKI